MVIAVITVALNHSAEKCIRKIKLETYTEQKRKPRQKKKKTGGTKATTGNLIPDQTDTFRCSVADHKAPTAYVCICLVNCVRNWQKVLKT